MENDPEKAKNLANGARRMGRAAKEKVDYTSNGLKKRDVKGKNKGSNDGSQSQQHSDDENLLDAIDRDLESENDLKRKKIVEKGDKKKRTAKKKSP